MSLEGLNSEMMYYLFQWNILAFQLYLLPISESLQLPPNPPPQKKIREKNVLHKFLQDIFRRKKPLTLFSPTWENYESALGEGQQQPPCGNDKKLPYSNEFFSTCYGQFNGAF